MLGQECTHQQAAIAPPFHRQAGRAGVSTLDQVPGAGREVVEDILLAGEIAIEMPLRAVFTAATEIGHHIDPAAIKPQPQRAIELWPHAVTIAAVTLKECGIVAVEHSALAAQDIDGNPGAVLAHGEFPQHFDVTQIHRRGVGHRRFGRASRTSVSRPIIEMPGVRLGITGETVKHALIVIVIRQRDEIHHATTLGDRQIAGISAHEIDAADPRRSAHPFLIDRDS